MWRPIIVGVSFANLCYLRVWSELLTYTPAQTYEMRLPPQPHELLAAGLNVLLLGAVLAIAGAKLAGARAPLRGVAQWLWLLLLLVPLNGLREVLASRLPAGQQYLKGGLYAALGPAALVALGMAVAAGGAFALHRWRERIFAATRVALLILAPFAPLTIVQAAWTAYQYDPRPFDDQPAAPYRESTQVLGRRVVWVVFDEWDQRLTFDDRPADLTLPEIDRFRNESLVARNAYPPRTNTLESMPSLITGRVVAVADPVGPSDLQVRFGGGDSELSGPDSGGLDSGGLDSGGLGGGGLGGGERTLSWREIPNVFDAARARGHNTALVGAYHPYCRVLAASLTSCWWAEMPRPVNSAGDTLGAAMRGQTRSLLETWRLSALGQSLSTERKAREFPKALERAKAVVADPAYAFALIHLLTPHFPHAYDRRSGEFTLGNAPLRGYYDSLALTDRAWGELRRVIETAGLWDTTTVLLSSDHPMKHSALLDGKSDRRVPFLLKLPQRAGTASPEQPFHHTQAFNTVVSGELLLEILEGRITSPHQVSRWLGRHGESALQAGN